MTFSPEQIIAITSMVLTLGNTLIAFRIRAEIAELKVYMHVNFEPKHHGSTGYERHDHHKVSAYER